MAPASPEEAATIFTSRFAFTTFTNHFIRSHQPAAAIVIKYKIDAYIYAFKISDPLR